MIKTTKTKDSAKYLVASEEQEPGTGWNYTAVLNQLSKDTSQDTVEFAKKIVDSFIDDNDSFFGDDATLGEVADLIERFSESEEQCYAALQTLQNTGRLTLTDEY